jgi:hypothetical protein
LVEESSADVPRGVVPLSAAIGALRNELMHAVWAGQFPYEDHRGGARSCAGRGGGFVDVYPAGGD